MKAGKETKQFVENLYPTILKDDTIKIIVKVKRKKYGKRIA